MSPEPIPVNRKRSSLSRFDRVSVAIAYQKGDHSTPEPFLVASEVREALIRTTGRGKSIETLTAMGQGGRLPAYRDESRLTRSGGHPTFFLWSEVYPVLARPGKERGAGQIVRIVPAKRK